MRPNRKIFLFLILLPIFAARNVFAQCNLDISLSEPPDGGCTAVTGSTGNLTISGTTSLSSGVVSIDYHYGTTSASISSDGTFSTTVSNIPLSYNSFDIQASVETTCSVCCDAGCTTSCSASESVTDTNSYILQAQPDITISSPADGDTKSVEGPEYAFTVNGTTSNVPTGTDIIITGGVQAVTATTSTSGTFSHSVTIQPSSSSTDITASVNTGSCGAASDTHTINYSCLTPSIDITSPADNTVLTGSAATTMITINGTTTNIPVGTTVTITAGSEMATASVQSNGSFNSSVSIPQSCNSVVISASADMGSCGTPTSNPVNFEYTINAPTLNITSPYKAVTIGASYPQPTPTPFAGTDDSLSLPVTGTTNAPDGSQVAITGSGIAEVDTTVSSGMFEATIQIPPTHDYINVNVTVTACGVSSTSAYFPVKYKKAPTLGTIPLSIDPGDTTYSSNPGIEPGRPNEQIVLHVVDENADPVTVNVQMFNSSNTNLPFITTQTIPVSVITSPPSGYDQPFTFTAPATIGPYYSSQRNDPNSNGSGDTNRVGDGFAFHVTLNDGLNPPQAFLVQGTQDNLIPESGEVLVTNNVDQQFVFKPDLNRGSSVNGTTWNGHLTWPLSEVNGGLNFNHETATFLEPRWSLSGGTTVITQFHGALDISAAEGIPFYSRQHGRIYLESVSYSKVHEYWEEYTTDWGGLDAHSDDQLGDFVVPGMVVNQDDEIGEVGHFGVPHPHLHFGDSKITNAVNNIPASNRITTGPAITSAFDFEMHPLFSSQSGYGIPDDGTTITGNAPPTIISVGKFTYDASGVKEIDDVTIGVTIQSGVTYVSTSSSPPLVITGDQNLFDIYGGALDQVTGSQPGYHFVDLQILNSSGTSVAHPYNINLLSIANPFQNMGTIFDINSTPWVFPVTYFCWADGGIPQNLSADLSSPDGNNGFFNSTVLGNNWGNYTVQFLVQDDQGNQAYAKIPALNDREVVFATPTPQISYPSVVEAFTTTVNAYYPSNLEFDYVYLGAPNDPATTAPVTAHTQVVTEVVNPSTGNYPATAVSSWNGNWDPGVVPTKYLGPVQPNNPLNATGVTTISGRSWYGNYRLEIYAKNTAGFTTNVLTQAVTITGLSITGAHGPMAASSSNFFVDDSQPYSTTAKTYGDNLMELAAGEQPGIALDVTNDGDQIFSGVVNMFPVTFDATNQFVTFSGPSGFYTVNPGTTNFGASNEITGSPVDEQFVAFVNPNTPLGKNINIGVEAISSPDGTNYYALYSSFTAPDPPPISGSAIDEKPDLYDYGSVSITGGSSPVTTYLPTTIIDNQNIANGTWGVSSGGTGIPQPGELIKFDVRVKNDGFSNIPVSIVNGYESINPAHILSGSVTDEGGFSAGATQGFADIFSQAISQFGSIQNVTVSPVTDGTGYTTMEYIVALNPVQPAVLPVTVAFTDQVTTSKDAGSQAVTYPYGNFTFPMAAVTWYFDNQPGHGSSHDDTPPAESGATIIGPPGAVLTDTPCGTIYTNGPTSFSSSSLTFNDYVFSASKALTDNVLFFKTGGQTDSIPLATSSTPGLNPGGFNPGDLSHSYQELFQSALDSFTLQNGQISDPNGTSSIPDGTYTFSFIANDGVTNNTAGGGNAVTETFSVNIDVNFPQVGLGSNPTTVNSTVPGILSYLNDPNSPLPNLCQANGTPVVGGNIIIYGIVYDYFFNNAVVNIISPSGQLIYTNTITTPSSGPSMAVSLGAFNTAQTITGGQLKYPDGVYTIQVTAMDCAGHQTVQQTAAYFLNTPPTGTILVPGAGQEVPDNQPLTIYGNVLSDALYSYNLYYASGGNLSTVSTSTSWIPMSQVGPNNNNVSYNQANSNNTPLNIFYFNGPTNNNPSAPVSLNDGIYTILLTATNCLGQATSFTTDFRLGNISPIIETGNVPNNAITYSLVDSQSTNNPIAASVTINVYLLDTSGSVPVTTLVKNLVQGNEVPAINPHTAIWDGTDNSGVTVADSSSLPASQSYEFQITATGTTGIPGTSGLYTVVKNSLPTITINSPDFSLSPTFNVGSGNITLDFDTIPNPVSLTVLVTDTNSAGSEQKVITLSSPVSTPVNSTTTDYAFNWNGMDQYGQTVSNGQYSFRILVTDSNGNQVIWDGLQMNPAQYFTVTGNSGAVAPDPGPSSREWSQGVSLGVGQYLNILLNVHGLSSDKSNIAGSGGIPNLSKTDVFDGPGYSIIKQPTNSIQANYELVEMSQPNNAATFEWDGKDASVTIRPYSIAATQMLANGAVSALYPPSASISGTPYSFVLYNASGNPVTAGSIPLTLDSTPPTLASFAAPVSQTVTNNPVSLSMNFGELLKSFDLQLKDAFGNQAAQTVLQAPTNNFTTWPGLNIDLRSPLEPSVNSLNYVVPLNSELESLPPGPYAMTVQMEDPAGNTGTAIRNFTYVRPVNQDQGGIIISDDTLAWLIIPPQAWNAPPSINSFSITSKTPTQVSAPPPIPGFEYLYKIYDVEPSGFQFSGSAPATLRLFYYDVANDGNVEYDFNGDGDIIYFNSTATQWESYNIASGQSSVTQAPPAVQSEETGLTPADLGIVYLDNAGTWHFIGGAPGGTAPLKYVEVPLPHDSLYFLAANVAYLQPPRNLIGVKQGSAVRLDWAPSDPLNPNLTTYNIYRHLQGQTTFTLLATVPGNINTYLDSSVAPGEILYYEVVAIDNQGRISAPSNIVTIFTTPILNVNTTEDKSTVKEGQVVNYTAVVENTGALDDASVQLTGNLPAFTNLVSSNPVAQSSSGALTWQLGAVAAGDSVTVNYQLEAIPATIFASNFQMGEISDDWTASDYSPYLLTNNQMLVQGIGATNNQDWIHTFKNIYNGNLSIQGSAQLNPASQTDILLSLNGTDPSGNSYIDLHADTTAKTMALTVLGTGRKNVSIPGQGNYRYQINLNFNQNTLSVLVTSMDGSQTYLNYTSSNANDTPTGSTSLYFGAWASAGSMLFNNDLTVTDPDRAGQNVISITNQAESLDFGVTATGNAVTATIVGNPLMVIGKTAIAPPANPRSAYTAGAPVTYSISYNNQGSGDASRVVVWDSIPTNLDFNSAQLPPGVTSGSSGNSDLQIWNVGAVPAGSGGSITLSASVVSGDQLAENRLFTEGFDYPTLAQLFNVWQSSTPSNFALNGMSALTALPATSGGFVSPINPIPFGNTLARVAAKLRWNSTGTSQFQVSTISTLNGVGGPLLTLQTNSNNLYVNVYDSVNGTQLHGPVGQYTPGVDYYLEVIYNRAGQLATVRLINSQTGLDAITPDPFLATNLLAYPQMSFGFMGGTASLTVDSIVVDGADIDQSASIGDAEVQGKHTSAPHNIAWVDRPALVVSKYGPLYAITNNPFTYNLSVQNLGSAGDSAVTVMDKLPSGITFASASPVPSTVSGNLVQWVINSLNAYSQFPIILNVEAGSNTGNAVNAASTSGALDSSSASATWTSQVIPPPVTIVKSGPSTLKADEPCTYQILVQETGPIPVTNVVVTDTLPTGVGFESSIQTAPASTYPFLRWNLGNLNPGDAVTISFTADPENAPGTIFSNQAAINFSIMPNPINSNSVATTLTQGFIYPGNGEMVNKIVTIVYFGCDEDLEVEWSPVGENKWKDINSFSPRSDDWWFQYFGRGNEEWGHSRKHHHHPVESSACGFHFADWNTHGLKPGQYQLRLFDPDGNTVVDVITVTVGTPAYEKTLGLPTPTGLKDLEEADGTLYALSSKQDQIYVFDNNDNYSQTLGGYGNRIGELYLPQNEAAGPSGSLYVADTGNHRVEVFGSSPFDFGNNVLAAPQALDVRDGKVYVLDGNNLHEFDLTGNPLDSFQAKTKGPYTGVAVDFDGRIYLANAGRGVVEVYAADHTYLFSFDGFPGFGADAGLGDDFEGRDHCDQEGRGGNLVPSSIKFYDDRLYITDSTHDRVSKFGLFGNHLMTFGRFGSAHGQFDNPQSSAVNSQGAIYVADAGNHRLEKFNQGSGAMPTPVATPTPSSVLQIIGLVADPNPFNPDNSGTRLTYTLSESADVLLTITRPSGDIVFQQTFPAGTFGANLGMNQVMWSGTFNGKELPEGAYTATVKADNNGQEAVAQLTVEITEEKIVPPTATPTPVQPTPTFTPIPPTPTPTPEPFSIQGLSLNPPVFDRLHNPGLHLLFTLPEQGQMTLQVFDKNGKLAYTTTFTGNAGSNDYFYDGSRNVGTGVGSILPPGTYTLVLSGIGQGGSTATAQGPFTVTP